MAGDKVFSPEMSKIQKRITRLNIPTINAGVIYYLVRYNNPD